ncbi:MAG: restriction endonuclease subunit S, partial [Clostridia bacterium]|nr:restriction endonuclease subunit S [Clostridia bacterium]
MSRLEELIQELCPNGVDCKNLSDVCVILKGVQFNKSDMMDEGSYPVINGGINPSGFIEQYNQNENTITISQGGASAGYVNWIETKFWAGAHCYVLKPTESVLNRYIFHFVKSREYKLQECQYGAGIPALAKSTVAELQIPVPPLEVQREIVRILDNFTLLTAELTAELTARKKQYEYYRDSLLSFEKNGGARRVKLGEIATSIFRGSGIKREEVVPEGIPCVRYGEIYTTYNTWFKECKSHTKLEFVASPKYFENGDILFAITGESVEDIAKSTAYIGNEKCLAGGDIVVLKHNQNPRYLAHALLTSNARAQKSKGKVKSKVVHSSVPSIESIEIPLPSLEMQERIANVLDNFESICSDLNIGLPAEIEARKKQYEYYRDLLLSFDSSQNVNVERERERA